MRAGALALGTTSADANQQVALDDFYADSEYSVVVDSGCESLISESALLIVSGSDCNTNGRPNSNRNAAPNTNTGTDCHTNADADSCSHSNANSDADSNCRSSLRPDHQQ